MNKQLTSLPNLLTIARIILIPFFVVLFFMPFPWVREGCAVVFAVAAFTDWLDGYLARSLQQTSRFGAFLDPVADKLMVASALVLLVLADPTPWVAAPAIVIIGREITISALREWMAEVGERARVSVNLAGKFKTATQMLAITLMLYQQPILDFPTYKTGLVGLYIAAALTLWSMYIYLQASWSILNHEEPTDKNK